MAISAKESPKNQTDKEQFAAASSCIATEILTLLFARKRRRSTGPVLYQPPRSRSRRVPDLKVPIGGSQQFLVSSRNRGKERCYPGSIQRSLLKPKVERCFTSLKTAAGAHNPRGMDQFILRQILGSFSRVNVIK